MNYFIVWNQTIAAPAGRKNSFDVLCTMKPVRTSKCAPLQTHICIVFEDHLLKHAAKKLVPPPFLYIYLQLWIAKLFGYYRKVIIATGSWALFERFEAASFILALVFWQLISDLLLLKCSTHLPELEATIRNMSSLCSTSQNPSLRSLRVERNPSSMNETTRSFIFAGKKAKMSPFS